MEERSGSGLGLDSRLPQNRLSAIQSQLRTALLDTQSPAISSVYSRSPNAHPSPELPSPNSVAKPPVAERRSLFGLVPHLGNTPILRAMPRFANPFAGRAGGAETYSPATQPTEWGRSPMPAQPSPVAQNALRHPADAIPEPALDQERDLEAALPPRPRKKQKHKRRQRKAHGQWTRHRKTQAGSRTCAALFQGETRTKAIATVVSGCFLVALLTMYLSLAISIKTLNQQIHILFILVVIAALVFFLHSLFRLLLMIHRRRKNPHRNGHRAHIPSVSGPEGFKPDVPIPVQLARDEEFGDSLEEEKLPVEKEGGEGVKHPPPAYGLWRGSVRLDPNLLHWQRVEGQEQRDILESRRQSRQGSPHTSERRVSPQGSPGLGSVGEEPATGGGNGQARRPPSYVSEDGVSYVVSALPPAPPSEIHPAFRIRL